MILIQELVRNSERRIKTIWISLVTDSIVMIWSLVKLETQRWLNCIFQFAPPRPWLCSSSTVKLPFVLSRSELSDSDWSNVCHVICENKECCPVSSVQRHVPREHGIM